MLEVGVGHSVLNKIDGVLALSDLMFLWEMESINKVQMNEKHLSDTNQSTSECAREGTPLEKSELLWGSEFWTEMWMMRNTCQVKNRRKSILGSGNSSCKGPEAWMNLGCLENLQKQRTKKEEFGEDGIVEVGGSLCEAFKSWKGTWIVF